MVTLNAFMVKNRLAAFYSHCNAECSQEYFQLGQRQFFSADYRGYFYMLMGGVRLPFDSGKNSVLQALLLAHAGAFTNLLFIAGSCIYWFPITGVELVKIWMDSPVLALMNVGALLPFGLGGVYLNGSDQYYLMSLGMSLLVSILFFGSGAVAARRHPILAASLILGTVLLTGMWLLWILF